MDFEYERNEKFRELCHLGDLDLVTRFFNEKNPDVNSKNKVNGWTALHWAAKLNYLEIVEFLKENGAVLNALNNDDNENGVSEKLSVSFVPSFMKHPSFHYADKNFYSPLSEYDEAKKPRTDISIDISNKIENIVNKDVPMPMATSGQNQSALVTVRVRPDFETDFVEIDIDKHNLNLEEFTEICLAELNCADKRLIKIRKLPNVLVRNTNDIKRFKNEQEIEFVFE